jgi:hypothetical protein
MTDNARSAMILLGAYTCYRYDVTELRTSNWAADRAHITYLIEGRPQGHHRPVSYDELVEALATAAGCAATPEAIREAGLTIHSSLPVPMPARTP